MNKQKTTASHFKTFPEPYRTQAIENTAQPRLYVRDENPYEALHGAFDWAASEQGFGYWESFSKTIDRAKTTKEYFEEFPEPYRKQALENTSEANLLTEQEDAFDALFNAFYWDASPQQWEYWNEFAKTLDQ